MTRVDDLERAAVRSWVLEQLVRGGDGVSVNTLAGRLLLDFGDSHMWRGVSPDKLVGLVTDAVGYLGRGDLVSRSEMSGVRRYAVTESGRDAARCGMEGLL